MLNINQLSYWERSIYTENIDFIIIGAGVVGYSCALEIKKNNPDSNVLILERGFLPTGASTKNAGFACFGSATELVDDLTHISESDVWNTVMMRWKGLQNLKELIGISNLDLQVNGSWDLITESENKQFLKTLDKLEYLNKNTKEITGVSNVYSVDKKINSKFGFKGVNSSFYNRLEGQINTGKMMEKFHQKITEKGIKCLFGIEVKKLESTINKVHIETSIGEIKALKVAICTNGFAKQFLPDEDVKPARAQVIITKPIHNLTLKGTFHYQQGYYYFRNIDNRILLGGGRNLNFKGETTTDFGQTEQIQDSLINLLNNVIMPNEKVEIDYTWSGIMGVGTTKKPIIQQIKPNISVGVRMGGMGVAIGSLVGQKVANIL
jgi:gamma-glutamylputrescine oxidase